MDNELLKRIKDRLQLSSQPTVLVPASAEAIAETEKSLGFGIPSFLKLIYANIANGGFGPGYGIIGLRGGHPSDVGTLVETYNEIRRGAEYLGLEWMRGLLPFCGWGCNIFSCVDCNDPHYRVILSEECKTSIQNYALEDFFDMWLDGVDILNVSDSPRKSAEIINPFTRKKTRVTGAGGTKPDSPTRGKRTAD